MSTPFFEWQREILEAGDTTRLRAAWAKMAPHLPQPKDDAEAEKLMHCARTASDFVEFKFRAYSHRWLTERNLPSALPDALKPKVERLYPRIVTAVGIAVRSKHAEVVMAVRGAMENAVLEAYAEGKTDPAFVSERMAQARAKETKHLFGAITGSA